MFSTRRYAAFSLALLLAACGGGGGGGSTATTGGGGSVTPPAPSGANMTQQTVQRADVQSSLAGVQAVRETSGGGGSTAFARQRQALTASVLRAERAGMFSRMYRAPFGTASPAPGCSNGSTSSTVTNSDGSVTLTVSTYYDLACTEIENTIVWTATQSGNTASGPATMTLYATSGTVTETASGQIEFVYNGSQITGLSFLFTQIMQSGKSQGQLGLACSIASTSSASCGIAVASNVYASSLENGADVTVSATASSTGTSVSMQASSYQSTIDGLSITASQFPDFAIAPSSALTGNVSMTGTATSSSFTLSASDSTNGGTITASGTASGSVTGTVTRTDTGATVASFTLDGYGNGTLTYGNGTQVPISNYAVQG